MEYKTRSHPLFSACGLNCGLCPRYQMEGTSRCPGCAAEGFLTKHPSCGVLSCSQRKGLEYCYECGEFPCAKYDSADAADSFITHLHQFKDMEKAKAQGIDAYRCELDEKVNILTLLLQNYNDGRRKNLFCLAVNLLDISDLRQMMDELMQKTADNMAPKEKGALAASLLQQAAQQRDIVLKLRK